MLAPKGLNEDQGVRVPDTGKEEWGAAALSLKKRTSSSLVYTLV